MLPTLSICLQNSTTQDGQIPLDNLTWPVLSRRMEFPGSLARELRTACLYIILLDLLSKVNDAASLLPRLCCFILNTYKNLHKRDSP